MKRLVTYALLIAALLLIASESQAAGLKYKDGDVISKDTVWCGYVTISGVVFLPEGVTLTIKPGTVVKFMKSDAAYREGGLSEAVIPGSGLRVEGVVVSEGEPDRWIMFTSGEKKPVPGDWGCIYFDHAKGSGFKFCRFEYAKYTVHAHFSRFDVSRCVITKNEDGSRLGYSRASYTNCDITGNTGKGLNFYNSRITVRHCNITGNNEGIFLNQKDADCEITGNNIFGNARFDLSLGEFHDEDVSLSGNWWGTPDAAKAHEKIYDKADDNEIGEARIEPAGERLVNAGVGGAEVEELWKFQTGGFVDSNPAVSDGMVYFGSWDNGLYAVKSRTGELLWKFPAGDCVDSSPVVYDGRVYFASWDLMVYCLNAETGREVWRFGMEPSNFDDHRQGSPAIWDTGGSGPPTVVFGGYNGKLYAIIDGVSAGESATGGPVRSKPAVTRKRTGVVTDPQSAARGRSAMVLAGSEDGSMYAFDLDKMGRSAWLRWRFETWGGVNSSPAVLGNRVYFGSRDGRLYCLDTNDGRLVWSYATGGRIEYSSPLVVDGLAVIGSTDGRVYAVDSETGVIAWSFDTGAVIYSSPVISDGMIVVANNNGGVYWLDAKTGAPKAIFRVGDAVQGLTAGHDGVVYAGSRDGYLHALSIVK